MKISNARARVIDFMGGSSARFRRAGDEARAALEGEVGPQPVEQHGKPVAETDKEVDVNDAPEQPGEAAAQSHCSEIGNGERAADRCQAAEVAIAKGRKRLAFD